MHIRVQWPGATAMPWSCFSETELPVHNSSWAKPFLSSHTHPTPPPSLNSTLLPSLLFLLPASHPPTDIDTV